MKIYFPLFAILFWLSSCIKVEPANLCSHAPPAPTVPGSNINVPSNSSLSTSVVAPDHSLTYVWTSPYGEVYTGPSINVNYGIFGNWTVVAEKGAACASDSTRFTVTATAPSCGVGLDSLVILSLSTEKFSFSPTQNSVYNYYYQVSFVNNTSGNSVYFYFPQKPTATSVYTVSNYSYNSLGTGQCYIAYNRNGYGNNALSGGNVTVVVTGSSIAISFCSIQFDIGGYYRYGSGYFVGS